MPRINDSLNNFYHGTKEVALGLSHAMALGARYTPSLVNTIWKGGKLITPMAYRFSVETLSITASVAFSMIKGIARLSLLCLGLSHRMVQMGIRLSFFAIPLSLRIAIDFLKIQLCLLKVADFCVREIVLPASKKILGFFLQKIALPLTLLLLQKAVRGASAMQGALERKITRLGLFSVEQCLVIGLTCLAPEILLNKWK